MPPTLEDVGRQCGVSRSTVSRVINDSPLVNPETRDKVLKTIEELGYAPNFIARSLTTNRTETLAITLPDITGGVWSEVLAGMDEVASRRGYHLLVVFVGGARPDSTTVEDLIRHRRADAIVTVASTVSDEDLARLAGAGIPIVRAARESTIDSVPSVLYDNRGGAKAATKLLLDRGCKKLIHIRGPVGNYDAEERCQGFREALEETGLPFSENLVLTGNFWRESGGRAIEDASSRGLDFDGIFVGNDEMAIGAIEALSAQGRSVPDDVSLVGFDDVDLAHFIGLSTVRVPIRDLGRTAAELAFQFVDGKSPVEGQLLGTEVIERISTKRGQSVRPIDIRSVSG